MSEAYVVVGAGGHAAVLVEMLHDQGALIRALVCSDAPQRTALEGIPVLSDDTVARDELDARDVRLVNGVGSLPGTTARREVFDRYRSWGFQFATVVSRLAHVSPSACLGEGVQVMPGAIVHTGARVGEDTIVNTGAIVDHDCDLGAHTHVAPGATLSGGVRTGESVHIGTGATVIQNIRIGDGAVVAAGAVVVRDLLAGDRIRPAAPRLDGEIAT